MQDTGPSTGAVPQNILQTEPDPGPHHQRNSTHKYQVDGEKKCIDVCLRKHLAFLYTDKPVMFNATSEADPGFPVGGGANPPGWGANI